MIVLCLPLFSICPSLSFHLSLSLKLLYTETSLSVSLPLNLSSHLFHNHDCLPLSHSLYSICHSLPISPSFSLTLMLLFIISLSISLPIFRILFLFSLSRSSPLPSYYLSSLYFLDKSYSVFLVSKDYAWASCFGKSPCNMKLVIRILTISYGWCLGSREAKRYIDR